MARKRTTIPYRQVIEWTDFAARKPSCGGICLFSDGIVHRVGWWSNSEGILLVPNADGTNDVIDHTDIIAWAELPNMVAEFQEFFG